MRALSLAVGAAVSLTLFSMLSSAAVTPQPRVDVRVTTMYAVGPGGLIIDLFSANGEWEL